MSSRLAPLVAAALLGSAPALAATELEIFERKVGKYAAGTFDVFDRPKGLCVCITDPGNPHNNGMAGVLDRAVVSTGDLIPRRIRVRCMVMKATTGGNITQAESCENFAPLSK